MRPLRFLPLNLVASVLLCSAAAMAQQFAPAVRIVDRIDESQLVTLKGNTHPAANAKNDRGLVSPSLPMTDLILVLSRDPAQQAAFNKFVESQYDSNSPNFHQWLTPEQVGTNFGPSESDIATVTNWLTGHGFTVSQVTKDHMSIRFSGTASQVQSAFHTEIHNLSVKGVAHIGNMSDPQIPAALGSVVVGVKALHNFFPRPLHRMGSQVTRDSGSGLWARIPGTNVAGARANAAAVRTTSGGDKTAVTARPQFGISVGGSFPFLEEDVGPYDFATIYNVLPLWNASTPITGSGQTIAIAGTSGIVENDVATFRSYFGLPPMSTAGSPLANAPTFTNISGNSQPVTVCNSTSSSASCGQDDLLENSLDVEWSGSIAKGANIVLVSSFPSSNSDDNLYDSESYIVNNVTAHIVNVSYGECELGEGTAGNVQYYNLWQQAAAEGIAVFVAAGDSGAASCDDGGDEGGANVPYAAEFGLSVSGIASTPWDTAVGGTDFNWCPLYTAATSECTAAPYWGTSNTANAGTPESNALGYVPEVPWNDTCANPLSLKYTQWFFSQITTSITDVETGCNAYVDNELGLEEQGLGGDLLLVDTVGGGGGASGCIVNDGNDVSSCSGANVTTNSGSITLVNDGWPKPSWQQQSTNNVLGLTNDGVRDIPDVSFFASDGFITSSAYLVCVSDVAACSYSNKGEPIFLEVGGTSVATPAMAGVMALIDQKTGAAQGSPNSELYTLAAKQTQSGYGACSAENVKANSTSCYFNDIDTGTNAMACDDGAFSVLGTASPNCSVIDSQNRGGVGILPGYSAVPGYDLATGLGSLNVANVVKAWPATQGALTAKVTVTPGQTSLNLNQTLTVTGTVSGSGATPTGTVTLTAGTYTSPATALSNTGTYSFTVPAGSLSVGTSDTLTVNYSGDGNYAAASGTATVTVTASSLLTPTVTVTPASSTLDSSASLNVSVTVTGTGGTPTGTVTLSGGGLSPTLSGTLSGGSFTFTIPANSLNGGADVLTATYNGVGVYASATGTATVTVTPSTFTLNIPAVVVAPASIAPGASATATITVATTSGYIGMVTLTCQETDPSPSTGDGATCTIPSTPVSMGGTAIATVTTTAPSTAALVYPNVRGNGKGWMGAGGGAVLAFLMFLGIPARRRSWRSMLGMLMLMAALGSLAGCGTGGSSGGGGGGGQSDPGTAAGTYTFLIQATGNPSVTQAVSTTFTVTVN